MCSTCECGGQTIVDSPREVGITSNKVAHCRRCGSDPYIIIDKIHVECKECFKESCNKKLRSTIGKTKLLRNNDPILVAYSGGPSSSALLSLLKNSIEFDARRQQKFRPSILHIDTQIRPIVGDSPVPTEDRKRRLESLLAGTRSNYPDWSIYWTTLDSAVINSQEDPKYFKYDPNIGLDAYDCDELFIEAQAFEKISTQFLDIDLTDQHEYIRYITQQLISHMADSINSRILDQNDRFKYVFSGSSATQLANDMLVQVILGRGSTIYSIVNVCDNRPVIPLLRPMRDFSKKEIAFYLTSQNAELRVDRNLSTFADRKASIQTATESFLSNLFVDYPSTYNTLLNTANKMKD